MDMTHVKYCADTYKGCYRRWRQGRVLVHGPSRDLMAKEIILSRDQSTASSRCPTRVQETAGEANYSPYVYTDGVIV